MERRNEELSPASRFSTHEYAVDRLLAEAFDGQQNAVGNLLEKYRNYLLLVANRELGSDVRQKVAASDVVQESIAEAWQDFERFSGTTQGELLAWLRRILMNNLADATARLRNTAKRDIRREVSLNNHDSIAAVAFNLPAMDGTPSEQTVASEQERQLHRGLDRLPQHYAQVIRMRNLDCLPFADIGKQLKVSADAARKLWERAVERLTDELGSGNVHD